MGIPAAPAACAPPMGGAEPDCTGLEPVVMEPPWATPAAPPVPAVVELPATNGGEPAEVATTAGSPPSSPGTSSGGDGGPHSADATEPQPRATRARSKVARNIPTGCHAARQRWKPGFPSRLRSSPTRRVRVAPEALGRVRSAACWFQQNRSNCKQKHCNEDVSGRGYLHRVHAKQTTQVPHGFCRVHAYRIGPNGGASVIRSEGGGTGSVFRSLLNCRYDRDGTGPHAALST